MNKSPTLIVWSLLAAMGSSGTAAAQTTPPPGSDEAAIRQAALDYMEGALEGDATRVARGVHAELNKVELGVLPQSETQILLYNTATTLIANVRGHPSETRADGDGVVEVTVFDVGNDIAAARAVGPQWYDLLQLAKCDDQWKIVNVLWTQPDAENGPTDARARSEVEAAVRDFIEGMYSGDAERLARGMHPELHKVLLRTLPRTGEPFLYKMGPSSLLAATGAGLLSRPEDKWKIELDIYDISHGLASVKATSSQFIDQLLLGRVNGEWKVINSLWVVNPEATPEVG